MASDNAQALAGADDFGADRHSNEKRVGFRYLSQKPSLVWVREPAIPRSSGSAHRFGVNWVGDEHDWAHEDFLLA